MSRSFTTQGNKPFSIHSYLNRSQTSGNVKSYLTKEFPQEIISKWATGKGDDFYIQINKQYHKTNELGRDSSGTIQCHEIYYLHNHKLKCNVVAAGPEFKVLTSSGIYVGNTVRAFSSVNYNIHQGNNKNDEIYSLGNTYVQMNIDSLESSQSLKKNFGMSLALNLWFYLSKGFNKVVDLKFNRIIPSKEVLEYSAFDSVSTVQDIDSIIPSTNMQSGPPAYSYFSDVGIEQSWYYNKTKDIFYNTINKVHLYISYQNQKTFLYQNEKRFEITF
jgi:hypothetical protein